MIATFHFKMNEQLKELRRQAIDYCLDRGSQGNLSEEVAEKFAELIILKCADLAIYGDQRVSPRKRILDNFGVKP